jgi:integrase
MSQVRVLPGALKSARICGPDRVQAAWGQGQIRPGVSRVPATESRKPEVAPPTYWAEAVGASLLADASVRRILGVAPERHRLLFRLLAAAGARISEALALQWGDLALDGEAPVVQIRRARVKGAMKPPKSQVRPRLGTTPPAFTLSVCVHLLNRDMGGRCRSPWRSRQRSARRRAS